MQSLFEATAVEQVKRRLASLTPATPRVWGKMDAPQMVAHCAAAMEMALGDTVIPQVLIGRWIGRYFRSIYSNDRPWRQNNPTAAPLVITGVQDLDAERQRLIALVERFHRCGPEGCTREPHPFFGKLTPEEWGIGMYKHLDHHLRQFGK